MKLRAIPFIVMTLAAVWSMYGTTGAVELSGNRLDEVMKLEIMKADDDFGSGASAKGATAVNTTAGNKSLLRAVLYSSLIPGLGEYYVGNRKKARIFFATDAATWIGYASYRIYGHAKESDYIRFAQTNANAQLENKSDDFRDLVGFYTNTDEYNSLGRVFDQERPYLPDTPENHWQWSSPEDQATYRHLKNRSREAFRTADFFIGIAIVTRVVSVIDAVRDVKRYNSRLDREFSEAPVRLDLNPFSSTRQVVVSFRTPF